MHVKDLMTRDVVSADTGTNVRDVARLMNEKNVGSVLITDGNRCVGIVTDRQIVTKVVGADRDPDEVPVEEVMHADPVTVHEDDTIFDAACMCAVEGPFRRLPVVNEDGHLVGVLSVADMALAAHPLLEAILLETEASVREVEVAEDGIKEDLQEQIPTPANPVGR